MRARRSFRPSLRGLPALLAALSLASVGCSPGLDASGGRDRCWSDSVPRVASLWRGTLRIDAGAGYLDTPEGDAIALRPGALVVRVGSGGEGELVRGEEVVAVAGNDVTLFGGAAADGLVVCAVEEVHQSP